MATSGSVNGGSNKSAYLQYNWNRTGYNTSVYPTYSTVYSELRLITGSNYSISSASFSMNTDGNGTGGSDGSGTQHGPNGNRVMLARNDTMYHDSNGNRSFSGSGSYSDAYFGGLGVSGSWSLDQLPSAAAITSTTGNISDEDNPVINYSNPGSHTVNAWFELESLTGTTQYAVRNGYSSGAAWSLTTSERNSIRSAMSSTNSTTFRYVIYDTTTGTYSISDNTITIINANPVFTTVAYHDSNSTTSAITGNNQYIIQNVSTLNLDISSANAAVAAKSATMVSYTASINSVPTNITYTTSTINQSLGTVNTTTNQILSVTATDSRGNTTTLTPTVTIIPYSAPTITATGNRQDGFDATTTINITASYSTITVSGTDKNSVNNTSGIGYKVWAVGSTEPGSYTNVGSTYSGGNVTITTPPTQTLDQNTTFNLKVQVTDALNTVIYSTTIGIGKAVFRIGTDGNLYNNNVQLITVDMAYPIGSVYSNASDSTNPGTLLGFGTWTSIGGYIVGYTSGDADFGTAGASIGAKTHWHWQTVGADSGGAYAEVAGAGSGQSRVVTLNRNAISVSSSGSGGIREDGTYTSEHIPPSTVVYMWQRTA